MKECKKYRIAASGIHGRGLFASANILANVPIVEYQGEVISREEAERREIENDKIGVTYIFDMDDEISVDGANGGNESMFINHCCDPNCTVVKENGRIFFYSKRLIKKGEELTIDYAYDKNSKKEVCRCGSTKCRGCINEL